MPENPYNLMDEATFGQFVAEAVHTLGRDTVMKYLLPICGDRHPLELNLAEREAVMLPLAALCLEARGGIGHA